MAETILGLFKAEVIWPNGPWKGLEEVEFAVLEWVDWFNNRRLLEPIGWQAQSSDTSRWARDFARLRERLLLMQQFAEAERVTPDLLVKRFESVSHLDNRVKRRNQFFSEVR